jgi:hypothetical protein
MLSLVINHLTFISEGDIGNGVGMSNEAGACQNCGHKTTVVYLDISGHVLLIIAVLGFLAGRLMQ